MRVLILNTFDKFGGAAVAANRLAKALAKSGIQVQQRFLLKNGRVSSNARPVLSGLASWWSLILFSIERLQVLMTVGRNHLFKYSNGKLGVSIVNSKMLDNVDVVNLHWVNFSMLSIVEIRKIAAKKPVIWTMHDMWPFTGGCHYAFDCEGFKTKCDSCFYLKSYAKSASRKILESKVDLWQNISIDMVGVSSWITGEAQSSTILRSARFHTIPNPIEIDVFKPSTKESGDSPRLSILSGALDFSDARKGISYLIEALNRLKEKDIEFTLLVIGKAPTEVLEGFDCKMLGLISNEEMVAVYQMADVFVLPSIQDNLPNTVMESMSCGTPVVAFDCGGVSDMVQHKVTGYLAENKNSEDLCSGIAFFNDAKKRALISKNGRILVEERFSEEVVARQYQQIFDRAIEGFRP